MSEEQKGAVLPDYFAGATAYDGFEADLAKHAERSDGIDKAHATVLPGALREAFGSWPVVLRFPRPDKPLELTLQPVTAGLLTVLVKIGSPLLEVVKAYRAGKTLEEVKKDVERMDPSPEGMIETVFCFVTPAPKLRGLLAAGRQVFSEAAMRGIGDALNPVELSLMQEAVGLHYANAFRTAIEYAAADPPEGGGPGTVFSEPPARMMTDLAGG